MHNSLPYLAKVTLSQNLILDKLKTTWSKFFSLLLILARLSLKFVHKKEGSATIIMSCQWSSYEDVRCQNKYLFETKFNYLKEPTYDSINFWPIHEIYNLMTLSIIMNFKFFKFLEIHSNSITHFISISIKR